MIFVDFAQASLLLKIYKYYLQILMRATIFLHYEIYRGTLIECFVTFCCLYCRIPSSKTTQSDVTNETERHYDVLLRDITQKIRIQIIGKTIYHSNEDNIEFILVLNCWLFIGMFFSSWILELVCLKLISNVAL